MLRAGRDDPDGVGRAATNRPHHDSRARRRAGTPSSARERRQRRRDADPGGLWRVLAWSKRRDRRSAHPPTLRRGKRGRDLGAGAERGPRLLRVARGHPNRFRRPPGDGRRPVSPHRGPGLPPRGPIVCHRPPQRRDHYPRPELLSRGHRTLGRAGARRLSGRSLRRVFRGRGKSRAPGRGPGNRAPAAPSGRRRAAAGHSQRHRQRSRVGGPRHRAGQGGRHSQNLQRKNPPLGLPRTLFERAIAHACLLESQR